MKIKMTNFALTSVMNTLTKFANVTGKLGYAISMTNDDIRIKARPFYAEREKLIRKYGTDDGKGNISVSADSEHYIDYAKELTDVLEMDVEVDFYQISRDEFNACNYYNENADTHDYDVLKALFIKPDEDIEDKKDEEVV